MISDMEGLEVGAFFCLCGLAADDPGGDVEGSEEVERAVPLVGTLEALDDLTAAGLNIAGCFSSTLSTRAFSGGLRYKPIISAALAANCGSVLTHHER
jgi:hypothetical protein